MVKEKKQNEGEFFFKTVLIMIIMIKVNDNKWQLRLEIKLMRIIIERIQWWK
jgi:hypothetical protein